MQTICFIDKAFRPWKEIPGRSDHENVNRHDSFKGVLQITDCLPEDAVQEVHKKTIFMPRHLLSVHGGFRY